MEPAEIFIELDESYFEEVAELFRSAFAGEPWNDDWSDRVQLMKYVREISSSYNKLNYGLIINGRLAAVSLGMLRHWWEGTNYIIEEFCVSPDIQRQSIGTRFMGMIEEDIKKRGAVGIFLQTDRSKPSYDFYKKNGFNELGTQVSFFKSI
ncbi:MAG: GNAT family N-acetyltransferase [Ruminococcus sp.]|nr:GNAT family N-acetyltransferase [Ruminococcus sp.]